MLRLLLFACALVALRAAPSQVTAVDVNGVIHPVTVDILESAVTQAENAGSAAVLVRLNTPGGLVDATRAVIGVMSSSKVPIIVYVTPVGGRAASAGFFLLEAADVAAMAPSTNTGAAHPVSLFGQPDPVLMKKIESDAAAALRSVVERRGRNIELAEKAVLESRSFSSEEALQNRLIDVIAANETELLQRVDGREVRRMDGSTVRLATRDAIVKPYQPTLSQRARALTSDPNIAFAIIILGLLALYVEFSSPGVVLPGVAGSILLLWGIAALAILPISWVGVGLLLLSLVLFVLEAKIVSHGILAAGGVCAMVLGAILLIDSPTPELRIRASTAIAVAVPFAVITLFLVGLVVRARRAAPQTGAETLIGRQAITMTELNPEGRVMLNGELWNAVAPHEIPANAAVEVVSVKGLELKVKATGG